MITLGIDYGASFIGLALVRSSEDGNEPLFAGTIIRSERALKDKTQPRAAIRRLRRTRKTKQARLRRLRSRLLFLAVDEETTASIVRFCDRRGYKPLLGHLEKDEPRTEEAQTYRFSREEFFKSLEEELVRLVPQAELRKSVIAACEEHLNRYGNPGLEIRPMRIDNRGVSRCAWERCDRVTPRRINAIEDPIKQQLVTFFQSSLREDLSLLVAVEAAASELSKISSELRPAIDKKLADQAKMLRKKARTVLRNLRAELVSPDASDEPNNEAWNYFEKGIMKILENVGGRNSYCREHSEKYVQRVLSGKQPSFKKSILESDIVSRREQILFSKLWRYVEARILPLAPEGVDAIVVERTAFDLLKGNRKKINQTSEQRIEDIYQWGPMLGFSSELAMLREEFGGLCAYCGEPSEHLMECEHIMPRSQFFFDSYLNLLPSCPSCNKTKGKRRMSAAALHISDKAYENYSEYLRELGKNRPLHALHTEKKGILKLMKDPERAWEVDRYLSLIADSLASIVQTQRGPRPLARYLYTKLSACQDKSTEIRFRNGRHTALYRSVAYPSFEKIEDKAERGTVNHALDAVLLASSLPSPAGLEGRGINPHAIGAWLRSVRSRAPRSGGDGIPVLPRYSWCVDGFENVDQNGYVTVDLAAMNWNQKDSATHKQDPYGWSEKARKPTKRTSALEFYEELVKETSQSKIKGKVERVYHPGLRAAMAAKLTTEPVGPSVADAMKQWLRDSVVNSMASSAFSSHPADQRRKKDLEDFARNLEAVIPGVIGIKMIDTGVDGKIDLKRKDRQSCKIGHRYMTDPANRAVILAYPLRSDGSANLSRPCCAMIRQNLALKTKERFFGPKPPELENGVVWGDTDLSLSTWTTKLEDYLSACGFHSYVTLTPCCVVCYGDGRQRFIRNFDENQDFKKKILQNIKGVRRTPFASRVTPLKVLTPSTASAKEQATDL